MRFITTASPDLPVRGAEPWDSLVRLARLPDSHAPDCGHAATQRELAVALDALADRAALLLRSPLTPPGEASGERR